MTSSTIVLILLTALMLYSSLRVWVKTHSWLLVSAVVVAFLALGYLSGAIA